LPVHQKCNDDKYETTKMENLKMKTTFLIPRNVPKRYLRGLTLLVAATFLHHNATANPAVINLGSTSNFAVLAGAGITIAGPANSTMITGDIGTSPTTSITGLGNAVLTGVNQTGNSGLMLTAKNDLTIAYNQAAGSAVTMTFTPIFDLGGKTLGAGVYNDISSFAITGTLTLDGGGNPNAVFIFQAGSTFTAESSSKVVLINGAQADNVFWQVGSSATLGTGSDVVGNILASASITADTGATVDGRLLAETGAVSLDNNTITTPPAPVSGGGTGGTNAVPDTGSTLALLGSGLAALLFFKRRFTSIA
jgi:hypothetical protein